MSYAAIYEQVSGGKPGHAFVASGLYRLVGHVRDQQFVRSTTGGPLRTLAQWKAMVEDHPTPRLPARVRTCGHCGADYELVRDASGALMPCDNCGKGWKDGAHLETFAAPDTLGRVVALQRDPVRVAETTSVPVTSVFVAVPTVRTTQAPRTSTLDGVVAYQMAQGLRDPGPQRLHTSAAVRCPRCNAPDFRTCPCPPTPPDTLGIAVQRNQERDQRHEAAMLAAHPKLEHWKARP